MSEYTQEEKILHFVRQEPDRIWFAKDFQNGEKFVGYEAGPRICGLVDQGYMVKVGYFDKDGNPGGKFAGYKLVPDPILQPRSAAKKRNTPVQKVIEKPIFAEVIYLRPHAKAIIPSAIDYPNQCAWYYDENGDYVFADFSDIMFRKIPND